MRKKVHKYMCFLTRTFFDFDRSWYIKVRSVALPNWLNHLRDTSMSIHWYMYRQSIHVYTCINTCQCQYMYWYVYYDNVNSQYNQIQMNTDQWTCLWGCFKDRINWGGKAILNVGALPLSWLPRMNKQRKQKKKPRLLYNATDCELYTSDAADE